MRHGTIRATATLLAILAFHGAWPRLARAQN